MRTRRWLWAFLPLAACTSALVAACVGDDPSGSGAAADGGNGNDTSTTGQDTGAGDTGASDAGTDAADSAIPVTCIQPQPVLFAPVAGKGTFCKGSGVGDHCTFGEHCCRDLALNTQTCAASCDAGADIACANNAECGDAGLVCCGTGRVRLDICTYAVVEGFTKSSCEGSCSNEFRLCSGNVECNGKTCTPTRALTPDKTTTTMAQFGACL